MRRAPGVPVVFVFKTRASAYKSYVTHRHMDEGAFNRTWAAFMRRLDDAQRCAEIKIKRCLRATSTPSTRRMLDSVAVGTGSSPLGRVITG